MNIKRLNDINNKLTYVYVYKFELGWIYAKSNAKKAYYFSKTALQEKVKNNSVSVIVQLGEKLDYYFESYLDLSTRMVLDKEIEKNLLAIENSSGTSFDQHQYINTLKDRLSTYTLSNDSIKAINLIGPDGSDLKITDYRFNESDIKNTNWYQAIMKNKMAWMPTQTKSYSHLSGNTILEPTFALGRQITGITTSKELGALVVEIKASNLEQQFTSVKKGGEGNFYILDENSKIIYNDASQAIGLPF